MKLQLSKVLIIVLIFLLLAACSPKLEAQPLPEPSIHLGTLTSQPTEAILPTATPGSTVTEVVNEIPETKRNLYEIKLTLDFYNQYATVNEKISYTNNSIDTIDQLMVIVPPKYYQNSFRLEKISNPDGQAITNYTWDGARLLIPLAPALEPNTEIVLNFDYYLVLPEREGTFGKVGRQINLANWYPFIPPYQSGQGWIAHDLHVVNSFMVGEHLVYDSSDFHVWLKFTDRKENMKVAATVPGEEREGYLYYEADKARTFVFSVSDVYIIQELEQNGITVRSYVFPGQEANGLKAIEIAAQAIDFFSEIYAPYTRNLFSIVEAEFVHNMEYDGMTFISNGIIQFYDGTPKTNLAMITPHETSHQWFFALVGNDAAMEPWLDEALATYSELLFYERYYPDFLDWWWFSRVFYYEPTGYVNSSIYFPGGHNPYRDAVYLRGALFMQKMRESIGDDAFFAFIKDYTEKHAYQIATAGDFFETLSTHSDVDFSPMLAEYFLP